MSLLSVVMVGANNSAQGCACLAIRCVLYTVSCIKKEEARDGEVKKGRERERNKRGKGEQQEKVDVKKNKMRNGRGSRKIERMRKAERECRERNATGCQGLKDKKTTTSSAEQSLMKAEAIPSLWLFNQMKCIRHRQLLNASPCSPTKAPGVVLMQNLSG